MLGHIIKFVRDRLSKISNAGKKKKEGPAKEIKVTGGKPAQERKPGTRDARQPGRQHAPIQDKRAPQQPGAQRGRRPQPQQQQPQQQQTPAPVRKERPPQAPKAAPVQKKQPDNWDVSQFKVEPSEGKTRFHDLNLPRELMHAIYDLGFQYCTPIQAEILFNTLNGKDATGKAQTGTGKTAAFLITVITRLMKEKPEAKRRNGAPRALVIAPTRELVMQIASDADKLGKYSNLSIMAVYGGMDYQKQKRQLNGQQVDILAATPGRLLDFYNRHDVHLSQVEIMVIDEADRMLDMGFIPDVRKIVRATPPKEKRQTLFFSATITPDVERLAGYWTKDAVRVEIEPAQVEVESVKQIIYIVTSEEKYPLVYNLITKQNMDRVIIFANRRDETQGLTDLLLKHGISCSLISGDVDQRQRIRTLDDFKNGKIRVLVATDVASRGIHVEGISHVINYTLPQDPEDYVHRIGRTGRAGATGTSISFATEDDSFYIPAIEGFLGHSLHCIQPDEKLLQLPGELEVAAPVETGTAEAKPQESKPSGGQRQGGGYRRQGGQRPGGGQGRGQRPQGQRQGGQRPQQGQRPGGRRYQDRPNSTSPEKQQDQGSSENKPASQNRSEGHSETPKPRNPEAGSQES